VDQTQDFPIPDFTDFTSEDGKKPYKFQVEGAQHALKSGVRFLNLDEMGLGKTVQGLMPLKANPRKLKRMLILCKAGLKEQHRREFSRWLGEDWDAQIINKETDPILPGIQGLILSFDTLWRFKDIDAWMKLAKIKYVLIDEVQHIKNGSSKRTNGVRAACRDIKHIGCTSGTPIKNHAGEYFPVLNLLRPDLFPTKERFERNWVDSYWNGRSLKLGGLKNPEAFFDYTKDFIIRRKRADVMPDLPTITRDYRFSELGPIVEQAYLDTLKEFQTYYNGAGQQQSIAQRNSCILAYLAKMRHITGIAKIEPTLDYVQDFLESTDRKIVIFCHHKDVSAALLERLEALRQTDPDTYGRGVLNIHGVEADARAAVVQDFQNPDFRILIAGQLASSEGLNLQFCSDCVMVERQWNPANEEQAEARFIRIGQLANAVTAMYPVAIGTVDEFLSELVEKKRSYMANTLDGDKYQWNETSLIQELAEILASQGGKRWSW